LWKEITGTSKAENLFEITESDLNADLVMWSNREWIDTDRAY
jgi:hypothetical protein